MKARLMCKACFSGLVIWNGEHYELSIKLWLCGGILLEIPCSRIGHTFREHNHQHLVESGMDYVSRNFKRVAEVGLTPFSGFVFNYFQQTF
jgi:polypeptide N-acetylgalactosaminyltransferase